MLSATLPGRWSSKHAHSAEFPVTISKKSPLFISARGLDGLSPLYRRIPSFNTGSAPSVRCISLLLLSVKLGSSWDCD